MPQFLSNLSRILSVLAASFAPNTKIYVHRESVHFVRSFRATVSRFDFEAEIPIQCRQDYWKVLSKSLEFILPLYKIGNVIYKYDSNFESKIRKYRQGNLIL